MKTISIGNSNLKTSSLAYGGWRLAGSEGTSPSAEAPKRGRAAVVCAIESGFTLIDLADIYGGGACETIFGEVLREMTGVRDHLIVATKCGIRKPGDPDPAAPYRYDFSADYIVRSCEGSLRRMGLETIDLFMLHRPDFLADPAEVAGAFASLRDQGKVRYFGVSNFSPSQFHMLQKACPMPLLCNQVEISLGQLAVFRDGTLDQCLTDGVTPLAWSPLAGGRLLSAANPGGRAVISQLEAIATDHQSTPESIALAWLRRHPAQIVPIIGSVTPERIQAAARHADLQLSREEWYRLMEAAWGDRLP